MVNATNVTRCQAIQFSDQKRCDRCDLVWDMNDPDPPDCLTDEALSASIERAAVNEMRDTLHGPDTQLRLIQERDTARRSLLDAIEYITHKGLYAEYLAMTGQETPL